MQDPSDEFYKIPDELENFKLEPVPEPEVVSEILPPTVIEDDEEEIEDDYYEVGPRYRGATNDPVFGYLIGIALSIGLSPMIGSNPELRYTVAWGVLATFGVLAWLFGNTARIEEETPENVIWGVIFGLIVALPLVAFGSNTLLTTVDSLFGMMSSGDLLAYLVFVVPLSETLFFRGVLQENRQFWMIALMSSLWSSILFLPLLDLQNYPIVAVVMCIILIMVNMIYGYVRDRNGLAAAWICQIVVNVVLIFWTYLNLPSA